MYYIYNDYLNDEDIAKTEDEAIRKAKDMVNRVLQEGDCEGEEKVDIYKLYKTVTAVSSKVIYSIKEVK